MDGPEAHPRSAAKAVLATPVVIAPMLLSLLAFALPAKRLQPLGGRAPIEEMEVRAAVLSRGIGMLETYYTTRVAPVERALSRYHPDPDLVRSIAFALVAEGERAGIDPRILTSVVLVENPWLDPSARSFVGAVGLMQVMPFHAGRWGCGSDDLEALVVNICHGARIFAAYLEQHRGDLDRALLAYNGCVRGTNTPDCHLYPNHVYSRAGRMIMRDWLELP